MSEQFEFDVAMSFLKRDLALATGLASALQPPLRVFVYAGEQELVAGTEGAERFRSIFRTASRLSVVLYRAGWGDTPWTGVEEFAIRDRCLATKYRSLLLVNLDDADAPSWVPETHIQFSLTRYSRTELVGAIKARVEEMGGVVRPATTPEKAAALSRRTAFANETKDLLSRDAQAWHGAVSQLQADLKAETQSLQPATGWEFSIGQGALIGGLIVTGQNRTIQLKDRSVYSNTAREAYLQLSEYKMHIPVQEAGKAYHSFEPIRPVRTQRIDIHRDPDAGWCWKIGDKILPSRQAASGLIEVLLDLIESP